jgi:AcrR family transcriptional regulator
MRHYPGRSPLTGKPVASRAAARRTQAERLAETRARILAATTACIDEYGFHQTSLQRVAQTAGVTVGAVQHHFPSKGELLAAVLEESFQHLSFSLGTVLLENAALEERVSVFVDHCWSHCNSPPFQSNLHILLGMRKEDADNFEHWINETLGHVVQQGVDLWLRVFRDIPLAEAEHFHIMLYCFSSLSGTALLSRISQMQERVDNDLRVLKELLLLRFNQARAPAAKPRRTY